MLDFGFLTDPSTLSFGDTNLQLVLSGWKATTSAFVASMAIALAVGVPMGVLRTAHGPRWAGLLTRAYVDVFRNIPMLVQLFLWFFVLPEIVPAPVGRWLKRDLPNPEFTTLAVALGVFMSARVVELIRAGVQSLPKGQREASQALGLHRRNMYRLVLLPQVLRIVFPPLTTEFSNCFKATAVGLTIGYVELTQRTREISEQTFHTFEIFMVTTIVYVSSIFAITMLLHLVERMIRIPGIASARAGA